MVVEGKILAFKVLTAFCS